MNHIENLLSGFLGAALGAAATLWATIIVMEKTAAEQRRQQAEAFAEQRKQQAEAITEQRRQQAEAEQARRAGSLVALRQEMELNIAIIDTVKDRKLFRGQTWAWRNSLEHIEWLPGPTTMMVMEGYKHLAIHEATLPIELQNTGYGQILETHATGAKRCFQDAIKIWDDGTLALKPVVK